MVVDAFLESFLLQRPRHFTVDVDAAIVLQHPLDMRNILVSQLDREGRMSLTVDEESLIHRHSSAANMKKTANAKND